jgi:thiamine-monophosphate kinase
MNREFAAIESWTNTFRQYGPVPVTGIGDDCAVLDSSAQSQLLVSTDSMLEGVHFDLAYFPLVHLGYKSVVAAVSDIYAMNGRPEYILVSINVPASWPPTRIQEIYEGIEHACKACQLTLVGGDTTLSKAGLGINVTVLGKPGNSPVVTRSGAKPTDLICVTSDLGSAYAGFLLLEQEKEVLSQNPEASHRLDEFQYLVERFLKPEPTLGFLEQLEQSGIHPTSMIDISDGLANEVLHLCKHSQTGAVVYLNKLPIDFKTIDYANEVQQPPESFALYGGEDYQLLFTVPLASYEAVRKLDGITVIGKMVDASQGIHVSDSQGNLAELKPLGWDHFKTV